MLFNSFQFLYFFVIVTSLYFLLPHKFRWMLLLISSCYFYMAFIPVYILILIFTIVIDFCAGILIEKSIGKKRKLFLVTSLIANIGVLAIFKYYNFINENLTGLLGNIHITTHLPYLSILLPIGLSFHTFQAMSYTIEVYRGNQKAERDFGIYSLYVMFYPQLVAGPIERPQQLLHQFKQKHGFKYQQVADGLKLMAWGLFKKVVIADRLAFIVDIVYKRPHSYHGLNILLASVFFTYQIFCDFSGYSDIAIGAARVMGFKLMKNFNRPFHSKSIAEFWRRWHISLSTWFRDYLFIPLGGSRFPIRQCINILIVFLISGLWHGAAWHYIEFGASSAIFMIFGLLTINIRTKIARVTGIAKHANLYAALQIAVTFTLIVTVMIFFRANNTSDAIYIIKSMFIDSFTDILNMIRHIAIGRIASDADIIGCFGLIIFLETVHFFQSRINIIEFINAKPWFIRWSVYYVFIFLLVCGATSNNTEFIYFKF